MQKELQTFTNIELKELLLQYNITDADINGKGKNGCVLKKDRIDLVLQLIDCDESEIIELVNTSIKEVSKNEKSKKEKTIKPPKNVSEESKTVSETEKTETEKKTKKTNKTKKTKKNNKKK